MEPRHRRAPTCRVQARALYQRCRGGHAASDPAMESLLPGAGQDDRRRGPSEVARRQHRPSPGAARRPLPGRERRLFVASLRTGGSILSTHSTEQTPLRRTSEDVAAPVVGAVREPPLQRRTVWHWNPRSNAAMACECQGARHRRAPATVGELAARQKKRRARAECSGPPSFAGNVELPSYLGNNRLTGTES